MSTEPAKRLAERVLARRKELDLTQLEVWAEGGPSNSTQTKIEAGELPSLQRATARKLDKGLRWEDGSARRTWDGGEPTPLIEGLSSRDSAWLRQVLLEADIEEADRKALLALLDETG